MKFIFVEKKINRSEIIRWDKARAPRVIVRNCKSFSSKYKIQFINILKELDNWREQGVISLLGSFNRTATLAFLCGENNRELRVISDDVIAIFV